MDDETMNKVTYYGQAKSTSNQQKGLAVKGSRLSFTLYEAIKFGPFEGVPITKIEEISKDFVRRASCRIKPAKKNN